MFSDDIFGEIWAFCNNNCNSSFLNRGKLTLAFFGRRLICVTKWARYCTCCKRHHCLCNGENRDGERDGGKGTSRGQVGVIAHSHCSCLTLSPTGHDYKAQGDSSPHHLTVAACPLPSHPTLLSSSFLIHLAAASLTPLPSRVSSCFLRRFIYPCGLAFILIMCFWQPYK